MMNENMKAQPVDIRAVMRELARRSAAARMKRPVEMRTRIAREAAQARWAKRTKGQ